MVGEECLLHEVKLLPDLLLHLVGFALEEVMGCLNIGDVCEATTMLVHDLVEVEGALGQSGVDLDGLRDLLLVVASVFLLALVTWLQLLILLLSAGVEDYVGSIASVFFRARLNCWLGFMDGVMLSLSVFKILLLSNISLLGSVVEGLDLPQLLALGSFRCLWLWSWSMV